MIMTKKEFLKVCKELYRRGYRRNFKMKDLIIEVKETSGQTRYDNIVKFIEQSESMVAVTQSQAEKLVSRLIPYTFGTAALTWLLTRNVTKAASVLMVDFSCAIEVAI